MKDNSNAVLTKLGKESSICGNQIVVHDAAKRNMASHHFGISCKVKDISSRQMLENMYNTEFCKSRIKTGLENPTKWKISLISLPLKDRLLKLPNNRIVAENRVRFIRSPELFADYKGFIEDLFVKGCAKKSTEKSPDG